MRDLSFERSRQNEMVLNQNINLCKSNVEIFRIKGLNLTYFLHFFQKLISKPYYWAKNIILYIKICRKLGC